MSPMTCTALLEAQRIILSVLLRGRVKLVGSEDTAELAADGTAMAARMLDSAERDGRNVAANSVAHYVLKSLQSGRRFNYAGQSDVLSPGAFLHQAVQVCSLDLAAEEEEGEDPDTLHEMLASTAEDPCSEASRHLDWDKALERMDHRMRDVLKGTAEGVGTNDIAARYQISAPRVCQVRESAGEKIQEAWGGNPVADVTRDVRWGRHVRSYAQRRACRAERAAEWKARA